MFALGDQCKVPSQLLASVVGKVLAEERDAFAFVPSQQEVEQCGLSGSIGTENGDRISFFDTEGD